MYLVTYYIYTFYTVSSLRASTCCLPALLSSSCYTASKLQHTEKRRKNVTQNDNRTITETIRFLQKKSSSPRPALGTPEPRSCLCRCLLLHRCLLLLCCLLPLLIMLLVIELGSDVMQNIVCNTKSIMFVTVITIPCKTIRKKKNDNKKKVMQKFLEFFYHLKCEAMHCFHTFTCPNLW